MNHTTNARRPAVALHCLAPDGESVREGEFDSIAAAWERGQDMGSRWYFYPVQIVTGPARSDRARILETPHGMPQEWKGRTLGKLKRAFAADSEHAADYCNGLCRLMIHPDEVR